MKLFTKGIMLLTIFALFSCSSNDKWESSTIDYNSFIVVKKEYSMLTDIGKIAKAVKLETNQNSLIGSVDRVIIDHENGDILIGDFRSAKRVFRFTREGKFIRFYGKVGEGPGEYHGLRNFSLTSNGDLVLLTDLKIIKLSRQGNLIIEIKKSIYSRYIESINNAIYIPVMGYRKTPTPRDAIIVLNSHLVKTGGIGDYDSRLQKYLFSPINATANNGQYLYFTSTYDFALNIFDTENNSYSRLLIPNDNADLDDTWSKKRLTQDDEKKIIKQLHRFDQIFCFSNRVLLFESNIGKRIYNAWIIDFVNKEIIIFDAKTLIGDYDSKKSEDLFLDRISGSYDKYVIAEIQDVDDFNRFKNNYSVLKDIDFKMEDNPIIVFFEFKDNLK